MFYLHYLCLFAYIGVQHILCYVFVLFVFVLCTLCCQFLWIFHFYYPFGILQRLLIVNYCFMNIYLLWKPRGVEI